MNSGQLDVPDTVAHLAVRGMQTALLLLAVYMLARLQLALAFGVGVGLGVTLLPAAVRREYGYSMDPLLALWITLSVFLHTFGALGPYDWFSWYDNVTHTVSAVVVAGIGYVTLRTFEEHSGEIDVPGEFRAVFIVVFVMAAGVFWELLEFASGALARSLGMEEPLTVYGVDDIVTDLVFNTLGALVVAVFGTDYLRSVISFVQRRVR